MKPAFFISSAVLGLMTLILPPVLSAHAAEKPPSSSVNSQQQKQARDVFQKDPAKVKEDIRFYLDHGNYWMARTRAEVFLATGDPDIKKMYLEAKTLEQKSVSLKKSPPAAVINDTDDMTDAARQAMNLASHKWVIWRDRSDMDDSPMVTILKKADAPVSVWLKEVTPDLVMRCKEGKTSVVFGADSGFTPVYGEYSSAAIRIRIDDEKPFSQLWSLSTSGDSAFAPQPVSLARKIARARTVRIEFEALNSGDTIATFNMDGVRPNLEELARTCHWKL